MIKRSQKSKANVTDDAKNICPICNGNLIITKFGTASCDKCDYCYTTIDPYPQDYSIRCMVCGTKIQLGQLCDKCKETMLSVKNQLTPQNFPKDT